MPLYPGDPPAERIQRHNDPQIAQLVTERVLPRSRRMSTYRAYYDGEAYVGRAAFMDTSLDVPMKERAPCVVSDVVRSSARTTAARVAGKGRFPSLTTHREEDDSAFDDRFGLDPAESAVLDAFIAKVVEQSDLVTATLKTIESAHAVGTAVSIQKVDGSGQFATEDVPAEWCFPIPSDEDPTVIVALEVRYRYVDEVEDPNTGEVFPVVREYRRVVDENSDTTFYPRLIPTARLTQRQLPPWRLAQQVAHKLGFCPVVWWAFLRRGNGLGAVDGRPIHDKQLDNIDALNFSLSQRHRGAQYCGEPQPWETGVVDDETIAPQQRQATATPVPTLANPQGLPQAVLSQQQLQAGVQPMTAWKAGFGGPSGNVRKRAPYTIWRSENHEARFGMLTMPADGLGALTEEGKDLLAQLRETFGAFFLDPNAIKGGTITGKAMVILLERAIAWCDAIRSDLWRCWLRPVLCQFLRIAASREKPDGVYVAGLAKALPILKKFLAPVGSADDAPPTAAVSPQRLVGMDEARPPTTKERWFDPHVTPKWGDYFPQSDTDEGLMITNTIAAFSAGLITRQTAVEKLAEAFGIENAEQYVEALVEEKDAEAKKEADRQAALAPPAFAKLGPDGKPLPIAKFGPPAPFGKKPAPGAVAGPAGDLGPRQAPAGAAPEAKKQKSKKAKPPAAVA